MSTRIPIERTMGEKEIGNDGKVMSKTDDEEKVQVKGEKK
jgi:hypothetical protein